MGLGERKRDLLLQAYLILPEGAALLLEGSEVISVLLGCPSQLPLSLPELALQHPGGLLQREETAVRRGSFHRVSGSRVHVVEIHVI